MRKYVFAGIAILGITLGSVGPLSPAHAYYYHYEGGTPSQGNGN
jgi:hypothetical protein